MKRRQYNNRGGRLWCAKGCEAEKPLCIVIMYFHMEVTETPVFVISAMILLAVIPVMPNNHTVSVHMPAEVC